MKINNKEFLNPQQQLYENTKDIENLKTKIIEWYNTQEDLSNNATYIARTYTNVPDDVSTGFLVDAYAHLYKITGGDDTTLLLEFYSTLGQYTIVEGGGGSSTPQIYYHNIHYYHPNPNGDDSGDISCSFVLPSVESTPFTYNDMIDCIKYYLAPAWDPEASLWPNKTITASGYSFGFDIDENPVLSPAECIVLKKVGADSIVCCCVGGSSPMKLINSTYDDVDDENNEITFNCVIDTVLSGLYNFPQPI